MTPRIVDKDAKREEIIRGTIKVVASKGVHNFKMIDIARATGIGKGTLYEYFPSKDDLLIGSFALMISKYEEFTQKAIEPGGEPDEHLRQFFKASLDFCRAEKDLINVITDLMALGIPRKDGKPLVPGVAEGYDLVVEELSAVIRNGIKKGLFRSVDPKIAARAILACLDGLYLQAAMGLIDLDDKSLPRKLSQVFLEGVLK